MRKRHTLLVIGLLSALAAVSIAAITVSPLGDDKRSNQAAGDMPAPSEIGASFHGGGGQAVRPGAFEPGITREEAEASALEYFLDGFGLPPRQDIIDLLDVDSTLGLYTGYREESAQPDDLQGQSTWPVQDREVWVVVIGNLPVSIRFGVPGHDIDPDAIPALRLSVAVDAATGEVINTELSGAGHSSPEWDEILEELRTEQPSKDRPPGTPTPVIEPAE
ncbi:MAG: hypothetical protein WD208_08175 [Dehalococcoidia bacterium]